MVQILRFYWLCFKEAWSGLFDQANAWATVLGFAVLYLALWLLGYRLIPPETSEGVILLALLSLVAAGMAIFVVRLVTAPARLYFQAKGESEALRKIVDSDAARERAIDLEERRKHTAALLVMAEAYKLSIPPPSIPPPPPEPSHHSDLWKSASEAIEAFAEPDLIAMRDKQGELFHEGFMKAREAQDEIQKIQSAIQNDATSGSGDLARSQRLLRVFTMQTSHAEDGLRQAWAALRADIDSKLTRGALIAKGFRSPHVAGSAAIEISKEEWQILDLNNVTSEATQKRSNNILYSGIALRGGG
jgi:hypothetical protein